jgi:hypothetical protein
MENIFTNRSKSNKILKLPFSKNLVSWLLVYINDEEEENSREES